MTESKPFTEEDYKYFIGLAEEDHTVSPWTESYKGDFIYVYKRPDDKATINLVKVIAKFDGVEAKTLFDLLNDHAYRKVWDQNMIEGNIIEMLNETNEIGYYAAKVPSPLANRDFVTHRTWRGDDEKGRYIIFNRSAEHPKKPVDKNFVRGHSFCTGYLIDRDEGGCKLRYITQSDPKGWIPNWVTNTVTSKVAPGVLEKLYEAAKKYPEYLKEKK
eukprot:TRINITY_DN9383_c1_g1_i1.p1 TRINITY_DN9383_c1_g1~~TRINITY_DN9383_c1_g1_i1.p1  ORF type:complete len:216 (-),score=66.82 TRINITY_DN9383_c1_g1_i1:73-720(-)